MLPSLILSDYLMFFLVCICLITDLRTRKIYNLVTFPGMLLGFLLNIYLQPLLPGAWFSLQGLFLGILIFWLPFTLGGMGAGDLKLLGMIGAFKGLQFTLWTGLYSAIAGGIFSMILIISDKNKLAKTKTFLKRFFFSGIYHTDFDHKKEQSKYFFPYSTAIFSGLILTYMFTQVK